ncbi:energy transducer TonB [Marinobacter lacisalsi]|uniref:Protein TonB n=1 Tax=Marinobacter lacisalsi TaxID=475979 RepID=A0ABV8QLI3_9GAMM
MTSQHPTPIATALKPRRHPAFWFMSITLGLSLAVILVAGIRQLVLTDNVDDGGSSQRVSLDFVHIPPEPPAREQRQKPEPPPKPKPPPKTPEVPSVTADLPAPSPLPTPAMPAFGGLALDAGGFNLGARKQGEFQPLVKIAPRYPERALMRGIEGDCTVEYTVREDGTVEDIKVLESACDSYLFEKPAVAAAARFRYQPRTSDGQPVAVKGVRNTFEFRIEEQ